MSIPAVITRALWAGGLAVAIWIAAKLLDDWAVALLGQEPGANLQFTILYVATYALMQRSSKPAPSPESGQ